MQALPATSDIATIVLVVRIPDLTWTDQEAARADPTTLAKRLLRPHVLFGAVQRGISDAAIDAGAQTTT